VVGGAVLQNRPEPYATITGRRRLRSLSERVENQMITWYRHIDEARSVEQVVAVTRDFLASWTPQEVARLPIACRPTRIRDESDVLDLHDRLVDEYRTTRSSGDELTALQLITGVMVRASLRLAELNGSAVTSGASEPIRTPEPRQA